MQQITVFLLAWLAGTSKWKGNTLVLRLSTEGKDSVIYWLLALFPFSQ